MSVEPHDKRDQLLHEAADLLETLLDQKNDYPSDLKVSAAWGETFCAVPLMVRRLRAGSVPDTHDAREKIAEIVGDAMDEAHEGKKQGWCKREPLGIDGHTDRIMAVVGGVVAGNPEPTDEPREVLRDVAAGSGCEPGARGCAVARQVGSAGDCEDVRAPGHAARAWPAG